MDLLPFPDDDDDRETVNSFSGVAPFSFVEEAPSHIFNGFSSSLLNFASICCIIFMLLGIPGNLITIIALSRCKKVRNATAVFIINLSCSDLSFCCFNLPLAASTFYHKEWVHGDLMCRLFPMLRYGLLAVSLFTILMITINRYIMIGHPRIYPRIYRRKYLIIMVALTWICAFASLVQTWREEWGRFGFDDSIGSCSILPSASGKSPKEFLFFIAFALPCFSIVLCYARIFYIVRKAAIKTQEGQIKPNNSVKYSNHKKHKEGQQSIRKKTSKKLDEIESISFNPPSNKNISSKKDANDKEVVVIDILKSEEEREQNGYIQSGSSTPTVVSQPQISITSVLCLPPQALENQMILSNDSERPQSSEYSSYSTSNSKLSSSERVESSDFDQRSSSNKVYVDSFRDVESSDMQHPNSFVLKKNDAEIRRKKLNDVNRNDKIQHKKSLANTSGASMIYAGKMSSKDRRLLKMILAIFVSFLTCYLPITLTKLFNSIGNVNFLFIMGYLLVYMTTCINPIIYVVMSSEYRQAYKNLLMCRLNKSKGKPKKKANNSKK
ncbi:CLUMA_CG009163, isoform A [Clunio marinus]|uniref:CLUMA_CG009163, isoform A n=1 Tax=Clunio marinus TaxID=568069 RepID=A0A1J1I7J0_9DIPT|nr:CLUMA_CG009163, isoform A [Clunio marinus]